MYSVGDKIVHPSYGPGIITAVEHRQVVGDPKEYYVIEMLAEEGTLMTPVARADDIGLRLALEQDELEKLLVLLDTPPTTLSVDFRERQADIEERLKGADLLAAIEVIRDLAWHDELHRLTERDNKLMQRAEILLAGEIALIEDIDVDQARSRLQARMSEIVSAETEG
jgi:CarD family transcriptional regulator